MHRAMLNVQFNIQQLFAMPSYGGMSKVLYFCKIIIVIIILFSDEICVNFYEDVAII
jgi:hypothetical protein